VLGAAEPEPKAGSKRQFFEHAGSLFSVVVSPAASTIAVNASRQFKALPRDRSRRRVTDDLQFRWEIIEGGGSLGPCSGRDSSTTAKASQKVESGNALYGYLARCMPICVLST
jgi:hypothetical protein